MIKLSIITINLNNAEGLARTLRSVQEQTFSDFEYFLIDGGSTDGSQTVINCYESLLTYWVSEPDNGIYHAMNKGIKRAVGKYCLFLNSSDWLAEPTTLESVFTLDPQADIIAGDINFYDTRQGAIKWYVPSPDFLSAKTLFIGTLPHQATFIKRSLFEKVGLYNEDLKIAADWLFFVDSLLQRGASYQHYKGTVAYFSMDGISCNPTTDTLPGQEKRILLEQRYPLFLADYEQLQSLESQLQHWQESKEYTVYQSLKRIGIIGVGVLLVRIKNFAKRNLLYILRK